MLLLVGYNGIYKSQQAQLRHIQTDTAAEQARQQTQAEVSALFQTIEGYRKRLPAEPETSWLVHALVDLAERSGVQLTAITQEFPQQTPQYTRLSVTVQFNANYHQLGAFVDDIERSTSFLRVDELTVNKPALGADQSAIHMVCSTLWLPPVTPKAAATGTSSTL